MENPKNIVYNYNLNPLRRGMTLSKRILIIENDPEMREFERSVLEQAGYCVSEADNARDGIIIAQAEKPNLILMDIRLPHKTRGIGAAKILRKKEATRDIPIIFVSAYPALEETKEVTNITNCGSIIKPFSVRVFLDTIEKFISRP